jgi:hypothetical protein
MKIVLLGGIRGWFLKVYKFTGLQVDRFTD